VKGAVFLSRGERKDLSLISPSRWSRCVNEEHWGDGRLHDISTPTSIMKRRGSHGCLVFLSGDLARSPLSFESRRRKLESGKQDHRSLLRRKRGPPTRSEDATLVKSFGKRAHRRKKKSSLIRVVQKSLRNSLAVFRRCAEQKPRIQKGKKYYKSKNPFSERKMVAPISAQNAPPPDPLQKERMFVRKNGGGYVNWATTCETS